MMRTATLKAVGEMEVQERDRPDPKDDEVLVEVGACGVCMTDYHMYHGTFPVETPLVVGHESAGTVVEVGADVHGLAVGDRVAVNPTVPCNACSYCNDGDTHLCENNTSIGGAGKTILDGAFAEYVRVPAGNVEQIGDLSFERAALAEPLACCVHGVDLTDVKPGDSVAVIGAGPIGLLLVQAFRAVGAGPIVVSELDPDRRALAADLGADVVVDPVEADPVEAIAEAAGGEVDVGAEAVGLVETIEQAYDVTAAGGTTLIFGVPRQDATMEISPFDIFFNELTLVGSFSLAKADFERAVTLLQHGRIQADQLISDRLELDEITSAFERMGKTEGLKHVVIPDSTE